MRQVVEIGKIDEPCWREAERELARVLTQALRELSPQAPVLIRLQALAGRLYVDKLDAAAKARLAGALAAVDQGKARVAARTAYALEQNAKAEALKLGAIERERQRKKAEARAAHLQAQRDKRAVERAARDDAREVKERAAVAAKHRAHLEREAAKALKAEHLAEQRKHQVEAAKRLAPPPAPAPVAQAARTFAAAIPGLTIHTVRPKARGRARSRPNGAHIGPIASISVERAGNLPAVAASNAAKSTSNGAKAPAKVAEQPPTETKYERHVRLVREKARAKAEAKRRAALKYVYAGSKPARGADA